MYLYISNTIFVIPESVVTEIFILDFLFIKRTIWLYIEKKKKKGKSHKDKVKM